MQRYRSEPDSANGVFCALTHTKYRTHSNICKGDHYDTAAIRCGVLAFRCRSSSLISAKALFLGPVACSGSAACEAR